MFGEYLIFRLQQLRAYTISRSFRYFRSSRRAGKLSRTMQSPSRIDRSWIRSPMMHVRDRLLAHTIIVTMFLIAKPVKISKPSFWFTKNRNSQFQSAEASREILNSDEIRTQRFRKIWAVSCPINDLEQWAPAGPMTFSPTHIRQVPVTENCGEMLFLYFKLSAACGHMQRSSDVPDHEKLTFSVLATGTKKTPTGRTR
ncbi:unnamed protein product, partial [Trichogramma brassicae]